jgi:hypothetical protein
MKFDSEDTPLIALMIFLLMMFITLVASSAYETYERQETIREIVKTIRVLQEKGLEVEAKALSKQLEKMK